MKRTEEDELDLRALISTGVKSFAVLKSVVDAQISRSRPDGPPCKEVVGPSNQPEYTVSTTQG